MKRTDQMRVGFLKVEEGSQWQIGAEKLEKLFWISERRDSFYRF